MEAWQSGTARLASEKDKDAIQFIRISDAADKYPPVTLVEIDKETPQYPSEKVGKTFPAILKQMENERFNGKLNEIKNRIKADPTNRMLQIELGMVYVEGKKNEEGNKIFVSLLKSEEPIEVQSSARNNLGNLAYLDSNYKEAAIHYEKAATLSPDDGGIIINRARAAWRMGEKQAAMKYLETAKALMPEWREFASDIPAEYLPK
jgi:tetratricopeptide (TPR) repeat protein